MGRSGLITFYVFSKISGLTVKNKAQVFACALIKSISYFALHPASVCAVHCHGSIHCCKGVLLYAAYLCGVSAEAVEHKAYKLVVQVQETLVDSFRLSDCLLFGFTVFISFDFKPVSKNFVDFLPSILTIYIIRRHFSLQTITMMLIYASPKAAVRAAAVDAEIIPPATLPAELTFYRGVMKTDALCCE